MPEYFVTNPRRKHACNGEDGGDHAPDRPGEEANLSRGGESQESSAQDGGQEDGRPRRRERDHVDLGLLEISG